LGPNESFDACGNQEMFNVAMEVTMPGGTLMTVAHGSHGIDSVRERLSFHVDPAKWEFWGRNLCVRGNWACHFSDYTDQIAMVRNGLQVRRLITATYPFEKAAEAYLNFSKGMRGKTILAQ
jgi:threonine dehydrogenase-like Zn-dependent dehydrogenase